MKKALVFIFFLSMILSSCMLPVNEITVRGSGKLVTETRTVKGIDRVDLATFGDLELIQSEDEGLVITSEDNLMTHILTTVRGSTLEIHTEENVSLYPTRNTTYVLKVKNIAALSISSSGSIFTKQLNTPRLDLAISSSGNIEIGDLTATDLRAAISSSGEIALQGKVTSQDVRISSSGNFNAADLQSDSVSVNISSSGSARIWVIKDLNVQISSSGNVYYYGAPQVNSRISSSGKVNSLGNHS
jgi:hypothetical protein